MAKKELLLAMRSVTIEAPNGDVFLQDTDLELYSGEIVVLFGASGSGKSTLNRILFDPEGLEAEGFRTKTEELELRCEPGLVPQSGALFDHLDVRGNLELAMRHRGRSHGKGPSVEEWLSAVDLPEAHARAWTPVSKLSGGESQRVAVARTLAGGKRALFLDEPTTGLDPYRIEVLAKLLREQVDTRHVGLVVTTHDVTFAAMVADRLLVLDRVDRKIRPILENEWPGPSGETRLSEAMRDIERALRPHLKNVPASKQTGADRKVRTALGRIAARPFAVAGAGTVLGMKQLFGRPKDFFTVLALVLRSALLRPLPFYLIVSSLLGFTVLYVIVRAGPGGVSVAKIVELIGGAHVVALTPPLAAFLFTAASGGPVSGWLGGMSLTKQIDALRALSIDERRYLWGPVFLGMAASFLAIAAFFAGGLILGGFVLGKLYDVPHALSLLLGDILDPIPSRVANLVRGSWLVVIYAFGIAAGVVANGTTPKSSSDDVSKGTILSIVNCTLWVVALELASAAVMFAWKDGSQ